MSGTSTPICARRSLIFGTAAAASSRSTVMRTSSEPACASAATWRAVPSTSAVSVLVMDCTTMAAPPPTVTAPTRTPTERRRGAAPALISTGNTLVMSRPSTRCGVAAALAQSVDLQHRRPRDEADGARRLCHVAADRARDHLGHRAAALAEKEQDDLALVMAAGAGEEGVLAFDAVRKPFGHEKIQRPVDRHGRGGVTAALQALDDVVGPERRMGLGQHLQHPAAQRRQPAPAFVACHLCARERIGDAPGVIVVGSGKS